MADVVEIRRRLARGESARVVAESLGCSRNAVRRYRDGAEAGRREAATNRSSPKADEVRPRLEELLAESKEWTQGKQQLTATRARAPP